MAYYNPWMHGFARPPSRQAATAWKPGQDFIQNTFHFPSFADLPHENDVQDGYWECNESGVYVPACTWFFMAEIVNDECSQIPFLRNQVQVKDREGQQVPIYFYPEDGYFDFKLLKNGNTILVVNGQKHDFLDLQVGLRIESLDTVSVAPCSMDDLCTLSKTYHANKDVKCWSCGSGTLQPPDTAKESKLESTSVDPELKKCAACKMAHYCSKECQTAHWKEAHKRSCKAMPVFNKLTNINYSKFDKTAFLGMAHFIPGLPRKSDIP